MIPFAGGGLRHFQTTGKADVPVASPSRWPPHKRARDKLVESCNYHDNDAAAADNNDNKRHHCHSSNQQEHTQRSFN